MAPLSPEAIARMPREDVDKMFRALHQRRTQYEPAQLTEKNIVLEVEKGLEPTMVALSLALQYQQLVLENLRKQLVEIFGSAIAQWSGPGGYMRDRVLLESLSERKDILPSEVLGVAVDLRTTTSSQLDLIKDLMTKIAAGEVDSVVLARQVAGSSQKVLDILIEWRFTPEVSEGEKLRRQEFNEAWNVLLGYLKRAMDVVIPTAEEYAKLSFLMNTMIPELTKENDEMIAAREKMSRYLAQIGHEIPSEGKMAPPDWLPGPGELGEQASAIVRAQAPAVVALDVELLAGVREYLSAVDRFAGTVDNFLRVLIQISDTSESLNGLMGELSQALEQFADTITKKAQGG